MMKGFVFDIDDTLYSRGDMVWQAAVEAAGEVPADRNDFIGLFYLLADRNLPLVESGVISAQESNIRRFEGCFRNFGVSDPGGRGHFAAQIYAQLQHHITLSVPLAGLLDRLENAGCALAAVTNGESRHQWEKYHMLGLARWIPEDLMIISGEVGSTKPDPGIFRTAQERLSLPPEDLWMVGDSYTGDIEGAGKLLWHTVWLNRRNESATGVIPDLMYRDEYELARRLPEDTGCVLSP